MSSWRCVRCVNTVVAITTVERRTTNMQRDGGGEEETTCLTFRLLLSCLASKLCLMIRMNRVTKATPTPHLKIYSHHGRLSLMLPSLLPYPSRLPATASRPPKIGTSPLATSLSQRLDWFLLTDGSISSHHHRHRHHSRIACWLWAWSNTDGIRLPG